MIVLDASALIDVLLQKGAATAIAARLFDSEEQIHVPHLIDLEVAQVLRRHERVGDLVQRRAETAFADLANLGLIRHPHNLLLIRVWELRDNLTAHDAIYVALAEALGATLVTRDRRTALASGHDARVEVF